MTAGIQDPHLRACVETEMKYLGEKDWVIRKSGYFYRPNRAGYTTRIAEAGRYTEAEAKAEARIEPWCMSAHPASEFTALPCPHCGKT